MAHSDKRRATTALKRSAFQIRDIHQEQENDYWAYIYGHDCAERRGRKRIRE